jgi:hypothetical protein
LLSETAQELGLERAEVADIPLDDLIGLRETTPDAEKGPELKRLAKINRARQQLAAGCQLPPLIGRQTELDCFIVGADRPNFVGSSSVTAEICDLTDQDATSVSDVSGKIVFIPQADPGYDWLFGQGIAGLVTTFGGANSHMAIRSAEFGLPAAIGIGEQRYNELVRGKLVELSPANGILRTL